MSIENESVAIPGIRHVILVASGKGGVGKSTVAVNLAATLARSYRVGLLDADIYGPSLPRLLGAIGHRPISNEDGKIIPVERFNMKVMSMGFLVEDETSIVWRGPMLFKAINQFIYDVDWGDLDFLVIDLPPGTGDVQLTLVQKIKVTGALLVTTPQNIALVDVKKAIDMLERSGVNVLGVIENMAYLKDPKTGNRIQLFPRGELDSYLDQKGILKLGVIPFNPFISHSSELGVPILAQVGRETAELEAIEFVDICDHLQDLLAESPPLDSGRVLSPHSNKAFENQESDRKTSCGGVCNCSPTKGS